MDIVGSVSLSRSFDPEDFGNWIARYQAFCSETVLRYGGYPARFIGDGFLAYFGYPQAHEDDPERAVRASLEIVEGVPGIVSPANSALRARAGVATGMAVVGEIAHGPTVSQGEVYGETPNLAARLQAMAEAHTVLIDNSTQLRVEGLFRLTSLGSREAKGIEGGIEPWRVDGLAAEDRFDALRSSAPVRLIGREPELALLLDRWNAASAGEGQVVLVSGEAGIGKSALLYSFDDRLGNAARVTLTLSCVQFHQHTALFPVLAHIERAAAFDVGDSAGRKRDKLASLIASLDGMPSDALALIAEALRLPVQRDDTVPRTTSQRRKEDTLAALVAYFRLRARLQPLLLLVEDAHWIDPTTRVFLTELFEAIRRDRTLIVMTSRPEAGIGWLGDAQFSQIVLNRLSRPYAASLINAVAQRDLPHGIVQDIIDKSDGVPLYLEELANAVLRSSAIQPGAATPTPAGAQIQPLVPSTLQGSLLERLDRIPAVKDIAHVCAVIGRSFPARLLASVLPIDEARLLAGLEQLVQAGLLSRRRELDERSFAFKHVLLQQAVYDSLLISRRRDIHARIARAMVSLEPEGFTAEPSIIAHHYAQAQLVEDAVRYFKIAGQQAMRQSAVIEAAALIGRALDLLGTTSRSAARDRMEIDLQIAMGQALIAGKGIAFPDVSQAFERAQVLCDELGDTAALFPIMMAKCRSHQLRGELRAAADVAQDFAKRAGDSRDVTIRAMAHRCMGLVYYHDGRLGRAVQSFEVALRLYDPAYRGSVSFRLVNNPRIVCCIHLAGLAFATGRDAESERYLGAAKDELARHNDPFDAIVILHHWCLGKVFRRDPVATLDVARQLCLLAEEQGFSQFNAMGLIYRGWARALTSNASQGCDDIERGMALYRRTGAELNFSLYEALMADALTACGRHSEAQDCLATAIRWTERTTESTCGFAAEIHRLAAINTAIQTLAGDAAVIAELDRAIEIARTQGGITWEARATAELAQYLASADRSDEAKSRLHDLARRLVPALNGPDISAVRELLAPDASRAARPPRLDGGVHLPNG